MRMLVLAAAIAAAGGWAMAQHDDDLRTQPLMRGALWWVTDAYSDWARADFDKAIEKQRDIGFDVLWIFNSAALLREAESTERDVLEWLYGIADDKSMKIIIDLPQGGWYGKASQEEVRAVVDRYVERLHARYGHHDSFWGWYLNYEINPVPPGEREETAWWRSLWKDIVARCHEVAPGSKVTISPFFLLDKERHRGFIYQTPEEWGDWWGATIAETGIDILMLQDSGEHLGFFTLEQREPFFREAGQAVREAGGAFWLNVESGEADVASWEEFLPLERRGDVTYRFTPIDWLEKKLRLAAEHADRIINWGYFPYMDPMPPGPATEENKEARAKARAAYEAYKDYYERVAGE